MFLQRIKTYLLRPQTIVVCNQIASVGQNRADKIQGVFPWAQTKNLQDFELNRIRFLRFEILLTSRSICFLFFLTSIFYLKLLNLTVKKIIIVILLDYV